MKAYYPIPFCPADLIKGKHLTKVDLERSIKDYIRFVILIQKGEHRFDEALGNEIWNQNFKVITRPDLWKAQVEHELTSLLEQHEKRLKQVVVKTLISHREFTKEVDGLKGIPVQKKLRKQLDINVMGKLASTNEPKHFKERIFLDPISIN